MFERGRDVKRYQGLRQPVSPDWQGLLDVIGRKGTPDRVYHMELFQDVPVREAIADWFGLTEELDRADPWFEEKKTIAVHRFCGFDFVRGYLEGMTVDLRKIVTADTAELKKPGGRSYQDEHVGPITDWESFERFEWPDPSSPSATRRLEWLQENLPDDMCIVSGSMSHFCEWLTWLMGYENFCYALYDRRDLVVALAEKIFEIYDAALDRYLEFDRVKIIFASDDMGYKSGLLFSKDEMVEFVLQYHTRIAKKSHAAGRLYLLHSCGNLNEIYDYLLDTTGIDGKHSFEDTIEDVRSLKGTIGSRTALLGGIDVDFLCRADAEAIRERVRETLDVCQPGGGYCLGTGNSVANYIPLENYLAMLDEGRLYL
jgi:uroporphyrinogen decarboxylase